MGKADVQSLLPTSYCQFTSTTKLDLHWLNTTAGKKKSLCAHILPQGKVKLSLCLIRNDHAMKIHREVEVLLHELTLTLEEGER
jgi:hypothetical protein